MRMALTLLVWCAVLALGGVTAVANFRYGYQAGHGAERWVYAIGATVLDVVKTFLPTLLGTFLVGGLTLGTFFRHIAGWSLWGIGVALSLWCAQGLYAATLAEKVGEVEGAKSEFAQWTADKASKGARLSDLAATRSRETIDGELAAKRLDRLWDRTTHCTNATAGESRLFCQAVAKLVAESQTAPRAADIQREAGRLRNEIATLESKISQTNQRDLHTDASAGPKAQAKLFGWSVDFTMAVFALLVAFAFEGVGLLPWIVLGAHAPPPTPPAQHLRRRKEPELDVPIAPEAAPAAQAAPAPLVIPEEDGLVARWAKVSLVRRKGSYTLVADVRADFEAYCRARGEEPLNPTAFGKEMTRLEFGRRKVGGQLRYVDIAVLPKQRELKVVVNN
jgi:hypothetical protein